MQLFNAGQLPIKRFFCPLGGEGTGRNSQEWTYAPEEAFA